MGKSISNSKVAEIIEQYKKGLSAVKISEVVGVNHHTVRTKIKEYEEFLRSKIDDALEEEAEEIITQLKSAKPRNIVQKIMKIMDDEVLLSSEVSKKGLDPLNRILGTIIDKSLRLYEIDQRRQIQDERDIEQDNFFNALADAVENMVDVEHLIDEDSKDVS